MDRDRTREEEEAIMNDLIAGGGDDDYSSQFLDDDGPGLEDLDRRDGSGEGMEGEDDGSGSRTLVITKSGEVYILTKPVLTRCIN